MSNTKALIKYVRDQLDDGPNITFGKPTVCDLVEALEASEHHADKLKSDIDAGAKDYSALMDRHDAQFVRAEKAESDKAALEEDLKATEENLKEASGFIEELLSGLKHRFPVQYADLEGDEYGDDAFSSHDLFEFVIDPAVDVAKEQAEAENARLMKMVDWLAKALAEDGCPYLALWSDFGSEMRPDWCICIDTADDGFDCNGDPKECWKKEAASRAVACHYTPALVAEVKRLRERVEAWEWLFEVIEYDVYEDHPLSSKWGHYMYDKKREAYVNARISYAHIEDAARKAVAAGKETCQK